MTEFILGVLASIVAGIILQVFGKFKMTPDLGFKLLNIVILLIQIALTVITFNNINEIYTTASFDKHFVLSMLERFFGLGINIFFVAVAVYWAYDAFKKKR